MPLAACRLLFAFVPIFRHVASVDKVSAASSHGNTCEKNRSAPAEPPKWPELKISRWRKMHLCRQLFAPWAWTPLLSVGYLSHSGIGILVSLDLNNDNCDAPERRDTWQQIPENSYACTPPFSVVPKESSRRASIVPRRFSCANCLIFLELQQTKTQHIISIPTPNIAHK